MATTHEITIAALLHDVGKVLQRADAPLSDQARRMEQHLCPTGAGGRATRRHVKWTSDFVEALRSRLPPELDGALIAHLACQHHRPGTPEEWVLAESDRLASGHDRRPDEEEGDAAGFREVALQSVFARLRLGTAAGWTPPKPPVYLPGELTGGDSVMPAPAIPAADVVAAWKPLADAMAAWAQAADLAHLTPSLAVQALAGFSERFLSLTPASAMDRPDVSLHDHGLVTAAIACAMHRYHQDRDDLQEPHVRNRALPKFRFVVGSLRGIQDFIFTRSPRSRRGIAKTFRAKSFYISALTQAVILRLLEAAGLPATNCIMNGGGRFILLTDSREGTLRSLRNVARRIQEWFIRRCLGILGLGIAWDLTASGKDMLGEDFGRVLEGIELAAETARWRGLDQWLQDGQGWAEDRFLQTDVKADELLAQLDDQAVELGGKLPQAAWLGLFAPDARPPGLLEEPLDCGGLRLQLGARADRPPTDRAVWLALLTRRGDGPVWLPRQPLANHIPILAKEDLAAMRADPAAAPALAPSDPEEEPPEVDKPATFGHLALLSRRPIQEGQFTGRPLLACLRADMDRLGMLFARGFGEDASIARTASLSRFLDLFFKDYLTHRLSEKDSPFRRVYTVFAGGDDLMLIGPWHVMFDLAAELPAWLDRLSGGNGDIHLSAALSLGHAKMPPSHMAMASQEQLDRAKEGGRNRVAVLNRVMSWDDFRRGLQIGRRLDDMILGRPDALQLPPSFIYRFLQHCRSAERLASGGGKDRRVQLADATWRSHFLYDLQRNIAPKAQTERQKADLEWLRTLLPVSLPASPVSPIILGITYALYMNRGA